MFANFKHAVSLRRRHYPQHVQELHVSRDLRRTEEATRRRRFDTMPKRGFGRNLVLLQCPRQRAYRQIRAYQPRYAWIPSFSLSTCSTSDLVTCFTDGSKSSCPATGISYLPKSGSPPSPPTTTTSGGSQPTGSPGTPSPVKATSM